MKIFRSPCQCNLGSPIPDQGAGLGSRRGARARLGSDAADRHGFGCVGGQKFYSSLEGGGGGVVPPRQQQAVQHPRLDARTPAGSQCLRGRTRFEVAGGFWCFNDGHVLIAALTHCSISPSRTSTTTTATLDGIDGRAQRWEIRKASSYSRLSQKSPLGHRVGLQSGCPDLQPAKGVPFSRYAEWEYWVSFPLRLASRRRMSLS